MKCALIVLVSFLGCAGSTPEPVEDLRKAVKAGAEFAQIVEPLIIANYKREQKQCLEASPETQYACVAAVRARYEPVFQKYDIARQAWCAVDSVIGQGKCGVSK